MPRQRRDGEYVMRATSSVVAFWVTTAICVVVVATPLVRWDDRVLAFVIGPALLLVWVLWLVLYRPSVRYDAVRAVVVNIGRTHVVPWGHVVVVQQRLSLDLRLDDDRIVRAVGIAPPRRPGNIVSSLDRRNRLEYDYNRNADVLEGYRIAAPPSQEPVTSRWDLIPLAIGAVLVIAVVVEIVVGV